MNHINSVENSSLGPTGCDFLIKIYYKYMFINNN